METHIVYIITDSNRTHLEVGYCTDLAHRLHEMQQHPSTLFRSSPKLNNVVHKQVFDSKEKAQNYYNSLRQYTRMQREKLIRLKNPNWLNLNDTSGIAGTKTIKNVVVYA